MLTSKIFLRDFNIKKKSLKVKKYLISTFKEKNPVLESLDRNYKDSFTKKTIKKYSNNSKFRVIAMGALP